MKKLLGFAILLVLLFVALKAFSPAADFVKGFLPLLRPASEMADTAGALPFTAPEGFMLSVYAKGLPGARVIERDGYGGFFVSQTREGKISKLDPQDDGTVTVREYLAGLNNPHGLAFDDDAYQLYIAEEHTITRRYTDGPKAGAAPEKIADLPEGGGHSTRTISFGPDDRLYVSIGSSCNVCNEEHPHRATILSMNKDGSDVKIFAKGLRNTVFFDWSYVDAKMWGTDMGRDLLGDDVPPDEVNILKEGGNYGWPICYGKNIHDTQFDKNTYIRNPCMEPFETPSYIDLQAHSAPLGLAFIPEEGWPEAWWYDLLVAYHGSWNRSEPTGYKIVRIPLDAKGNPEGAVQDFITGFQTPEGEIIGRPVDLLIEPGGVLYITDDRAGVVYRLHRTESVL